MTNEKGGRWKKELAFVLYHFFFSFEHSLGCADLRPLSLAVIALFQLNEKKVHTRTHSVG